MCWSDQNTWDVRTAADQNVHEIRGTYIDRLARFGNREIRSPDTRSAKEEVAARGETRRGDRWKEVTDDIDLHHYPGKRLEAFRRRYGALARGATALPERADHRCPHAHPAPSRCTADARSGSHEPAGRIRADGGGGGARDHRVRLQALDGSAWLADRESCQFARRDGEAEVYRGDSRRTTAPT